MTSERKPQIFLCINTSWNIVNFRQALIRGLQAQGYEVTAVAPRDRYSDQLAALGCRYVELPMDNQGTSLLRDLGLLLRFWRLLRHYRPDVLLCYTVKPNVYGGLAARLAGVPVINNVAGLGTVFIKPGLVTRVVKLLYWAAFRHSSRVFFQNEADQAYFESAGLVAAQRSERLPGSGIDLVRFQPLPLPQQPPFRFLLIARLVYDKGVREYVEAARKLRGEGCDAEFAMVGFLDVENQTAVQRADVDAWVAEGVINYLGVSDEIESVIRDCHCVVLPSYREGLSRTLLEGAASARPLVTTDVPGCRELVAGGVNGYLARARNSEDLANQMRRMLSLTAAELAGMARASRELVEKHYDEAIVVRRYQDVIAGVLRVPQNS